MVLEANSEQSSIQSYEDVHPETVKSNVVLRKLDMRWGQKVKGKARERENNSVISYITSSH